jgi:hypothetical protein
MRAIGVLGAVSTTVAVVGSLGAAAPASASNYGVELNGTYRVISNGEWATTSAGPFGAGGAQVFIDQPTVVQTWTISSSCTSPIRCDGTVTSDQGWSSPVSTTGDYWVVDHFVENWLPCPDGTVVPGAQKFLFWGWNPVASDRDMRYNDVMPGRDRTQAASGACGQNKPVVTEYPLRVEKLS